MKKREAKPGDVVKIDLGDSVHSYARFLKEATFAFYDNPVVRDLPVEEVIAAPVLFQVAVMAHAIKKGRWKVVGNAPLEAPLQRPSPKFLQDILRPDQFSIYEEGKIRGATRDECIGLERSAVWDPEHVEDRLRDYYAGRQNKWVESLKIK